MEDDKFKIHLLIDNERYPLTILRKDEQLYRDAAKQIDYKLNKYRSMYPSFSAAKHWAMAALELSFENISMKDRNDTLPYTEKIRQLTEDVENCIHPQTDE
ncbi:MULTISPECIES: cell division protein ZapA [Bacteroidaceae]|jgi:cell division protein ZapA|uniref:cell division protein ZapA n=1 Tax=Bacteroidaceae TaxID=815 RepID=UPI000B386F12|nr:MULTISPECIES: cell division protein ZapA [Bacteroidaceae]MDM8305577.1 cell division protein ZapA [Phocaeicola salanitronis]OUO22723.1 cell division protein ZapA [Bacteroides sp. An322]HJC97709.1 cell division protein ZapA [Candidatus Phocaeicola merdavium]